MTLTELNAWIDANVFTTNNRMNTGASFRQVLKKVTDETFGKVETMIGATALKTPGTNWATGKGLEIWGSGGTALGLASNYLEASIKTKIGGAGEMEFWNTQIDTAFSFRDGAARTERFQLKSGNAWLPGKMHVGAGTDRTSKAGMLNIMGSAFAYNGSYYIEAASSNGFYMYNTSDANRLGYVTMTGDGDFLNRYINIGSNSSAYGVKFQNGVLEFARFTDSGVMLINKTTDNGLGKLQVNGNIWGKNIFTVESDSSNASSAKIVLNQTTSNSWSIENVWPGHLHFFRGTTNHVSILNDGNLDIKTGVLMPRLTTTQRDALSASNGMIIYNTTTNVFQGRANGAWVNL